MRDTGYPKHPGDVALLPGVCDALAQLRLLGYELVLISNQAGVPRGYMTRPDVAAVHARLEQCLAEGGARLSAFYYCYDAPDSASQFRKPAPGMLLQARDELGISLEDSFMIGDKDIDVEAGRRAGCRTILYREGQRAPLTSALADRVAASWPEIVGIISSEHP
jgi:D,D-heptose 1,7-bisphosphate phosphatase